MSNRLQQEVWALDRCSGCGSCTAACSKGVLYWGAEQHPLLEEREKRLGLSKLKLRTCEVCEHFCELSCPRLVERVPMEAQMIVSARSREWAGGVGGSPAEVIHALLVAACAADLIDGVILPDVDPWSLRPVTRIATTPDEILSSSMLPYLWTPVLSQLNEAIFQRGLTRLAIVGTPCVAEGARRLMTSSHERLWPYREAIRLTISSFCSGVYMPHVIDELLDRGLGIRRQQIRSLSTRAGDGMLLVALWDGTERAVPLTEVEPFTRAGCGSCDDYLGESADLAVGAIGAPDGHAALIVRTDEGQHFVRCAVSAALLEVGDGVDLGALHAAKTEKDRRARAQALDDVRILMLDALQDAGKREKVRKEFAHLCGASPAGTKKEEVGCGHCNGC